ncbi:MAG: DoxX family protein [Bacteroidota bacterium]
MINTLFNSGNYSKNINGALLLLRFVSGGFMLIHGIGKFSKLFGEAPIAFADPIGIGETASLALAVFAEVFCALFLIIGFLTRLAAIPLLITMLVAAFVVHSNDGFGKQELPLLYAAIYIVIAIAGAGKISIDNWIYKKINRV